MVEFQVVTKDDLGTAARSQSHLVGVLHHCHVVADEAVPQRVLFPLHPGLKRNSPLGFVEVIMAMWSHGTGLLQVRSKPGGEVLADQHQSCDWPVAPCLTKRKRR